MFDQVSGSRNLEVQRTGHEAALSADVTAMREGMAHRAAEESLWQPQIMPRHPQHHLPSNQSGGGADALLPKIILRATHPGHGTAADDLALKLKMENDIRTGQSQAK